MNRLATLLILACIAAAPAAWAQPRPGDHSGGAGANRQGEERAAQRQEHRREHMERRNQQGERPVPGGQRMSPEERRALREQIRDHGRDIYRDPAKR